MVVVVVVIGGGIDDVVSIGAVVHAVASSTTTRSVRRITMTLGDWRAVRADPPGTEMGKHGPSL